MGVSCTKIDDDDDDDDNNQRDDGLCGTQETLSAREGEE